MNKIKELMLKGCSRVASAKNAMANNVADENISKVACNKLLLSRWKGFLL